MQQLPNLAAQGNFVPVKLMVEMGWPITVRGGDWQASVLNLAVYQGNAEMTDWLLSHGANWEEKHGFGGNVMGTLGYGSSENGAGYPSGDWVGCAKALVAHGMLLPPNGYDFSAQVEDYFDSLRTADKKEGTGQR